MENRKIKAIIFDFDGTLVDTDDLVISSYREVFKVHRPDYVLTNEEEISFLGPTLKEKFEEYFTEDFEVLLKTYQDYAFAHTKEKAYVYDGVEAMFTSLKEKGYIIGLVTSRFRKSLNHVLDVFPLEKYFDVIITLDEVAACKPSPEGLNLVKKIFELKNEQMIYIGDNKTDYQAAKNAGIKVGLVSWSKGRDNSLLNPDYLITNYQEFEKLF